MPLPQEPERRWAGVVPPEGSGRRLDQLLATLVPDLTRAQAQRLIREGLCLVEGRPGQSSDRPPAGTRISVTLRAPHTDIAAETTQLEILFEDEVIIVLNKPAGMAVHPARGTPTGTLLNALMGHLGPEARPSLVHRLDRDTSGALLAAKTPQAHHELRRQMEAKELRRTYWALVWGIVTPAAGVIQATLARARGDKTRMTVCPRGKEAVTHYRTLQTSLAEGEPVTLVEARLETGRTHQIRVHFEWLGHPLVGERVYRGARATRTATDGAFPGQALHSRALQFSHPVSGQAMEVEAPLPEAFARFVTVGDGRGR